MSSTTVFTGVLSALHALLRYLTTLLTMFTTTNHDDLESGLPAVDSQDTTSSSFHCQGIDESFTYAGPFGKPPAHSSIDDVLDVEQT